MATTRDTAPNVDLDAFEKDLDQLEPMADCIRFASHAMADPLARARQGQMAREVARVARRKGTGHAEVARRQANLDRATERFGVLAEERDRSRVARPPQDKETATVWGRVTDRGAPKAGLTVIASGDAGRLAFDCTDDQGGFSMTVPPETQFRLSVRAKDGAELYRDPAAASLIAGQQQYREIDLTRGAEPPCPEPGDEPDTGPDEFAMVDVVGQPERTALAVISNLGLTPGKRRTEPAPDLVGRVVSHTPEAGATVKKGDPVDYVVGVQAGTAVPDLTGLTLEQAEATLKKAGLALGSVSQVPVTDETPGLVLEQDPLPRTLVDPGSAVDVKIGVAEEPGFVTVPDVTGGSVDEADARLKEAGLDRGPVSEVPGPAEKVGLVINQSPPAGAKVAPGSAVALIVGAPEDAPDGILVPSVVRLFQHDAEAILADAGLAVGEVKGLPGPDALVGRVVEQSPEAGSVAQPGDKVALVVGERQSDTGTARVPPVTGRRQAEAEEIVKAAGFEAKVSTTPVSSRSQVGIVLSQTPAAGSIAPAGSTVALRVGALREIGGGPVPRGGNLTPRVAEIAEKAEAELGGAGNVAVHLRTGGVRTVADLDAFLARDRRELRDALGIRTLAEVDRLLRALRRALAGGG